MKHAPDPPYRRHRLPAKATADAAWLCLRFRLSLRIVEEIFAAYGIEVSQVRGFV
jgi:putative transposase